MVPDLQVLPVRRRWGRRAASEALDPPTACRGSSRRGTPPSSHTHTQKVVISRQTEEKEKKKPRKPPRVSHTVSLAGKYLLFYLLERRLLDDALHRLLLDGLCDLLLSQREILQEGKRISSSAHVEDGDGCCSFLTSNLSPYLVSCDLKGVGVQGDESRMERQMFGVLKLSRMKKVSL